jgi:uncharacterized membrane protein
VQIHPGHSLLYRIMRLLEGANLFFLLTVLLLAALLALGNFQEFLDSSQLMLLGLLSLASMLGVASGICYIVALVIWMIRRHRLMILRFAYGVVATTIAGAFAVAGGALDAFVRPA